MTFTQPPPRDVTLGHVIQLQALLFHLGGGNQASSSTMVAKIRSNKCRPFPASLGSLHSSHPNSPSSGQKFSASSPHGTFACAVPSVKDALLLLYHPPPLGDLLFVRHALGSGLSSPGSTVLVSFLCCCPGTRSLSERLPP